MAYFYPIFTNPNPSKSIIPSHPFPISPFLYFFFGLGDIEGVVDVFLFFYGEEGVQEGVYERRREWAQREDMERKGV